MNDIEITSSKKFIRLNNNYLIKIDAINAIKTYDIDFEYKGASFYIQLLLKGREYSLEIKYDTAAERDKDFERLTDEITII